MANLGLIQGIATGLREGVNSYRTERDRQDRLAQEKEDRNLRVAAFEEEKIKNKAVLDKMMQDKIDKQNEEILTGAKSGFRITRDPVTGVVTPVPDKEFMGMKDARDPLKSLLTGLHVKKTQMDIEAAEGGKDSEKQAAGFASKMKDAETNLNSILESGFDPTGGQSQAEGMFLKGPLQAVKSADQKRYEAAKIAFVNSQLRDESGASISPSEREAAEIQYFPQPGDTPDVLQQKANQRALAIRSMELSAGPAMKKMGDVQKGLVQPEKKATGLIKPEQKLTKKDIQVGAVMEGHKFKGGNPADPKNWEKVGILQVGN